jgi:glycine oxidase
VDNARLALALAASAAARGATLFSDRPEAALIVEDGRVAGVKSGGLSLSAPVVIEAMGAWSARLAGDPSPPPVEPVRGQIVAFDVAPGTLRHVVCTPRGYVVPRANGRLLAGSTLERVGYDKRVTADGLRTVIGIAVEIAPALAVVSMADSWAGLRPGTPDHLPVIGPGAARGLFHATGLYRSGILLGPLVGETVARLAMGTDPGIDLAPFSPARFRPGA